MDKLYHFNVNIHQKFPIQFILMLFKFSHVIIFTYNFEFVTVDQSRHWWISDYQHLPKDECDLGADWLTKKWSESPKQTHDHNQRQVGTPDALEIQAESDCLLRKKTWYESPKQTHHPPPQPKADWHTRHTWH